MSFKQYQITATITNIGFSSGDYTFDLITDSFVDTEYLLMHKIRTLMSLSKGSKWMYDVKYSNVVILKSEKIAAEQESLSYTVK